MVVADVAAVLEPRASCLATHTSWQTELFMLTCNNIRASALAKGFKLRKEHSKGAQLRCRATLAQSWMRGSRSVLVECSVLQASIRTLSNQGRSHPVEQAGTWVLGKGHAAPATQLYVLFQGAVEVAVAVAHGATLPNLKLVHDCEPIKPAGMHNKHNFGHSPGLLTQLGKARQTHH